MMNERGKSDRPIVPEKSPNQVGTPAAEGREGRGLVEENLGQQNAFRTPRREDVQNALERVREAARKSQETRFTALLHHVYNVEMLEYAYRRLKKMRRPA